MKVICSPYEYYIVYYLIRLPGNQLTINLREPEQNWGSCYPPILGFLEAKEKLKKRKAKVSLSSKQKWVPGNGNKVFGKYYYTP